MADQTRREFLTTMLRGISLYPLYGGLIALRTEQAFAQSATIQRIEISSYKLHERLSSPIVATPYEWAVNGRTKYALVTQQMQLIVQAWHEVLQNLDTALNLDLTNAVLSPARSENLAMLVPSQERQKRLLWHEMVTWTPARLKQNLESYVRPEAYPKSLNGLSFVHEDKIVAVYPGGPYFLENRQSEPQSSSLEIRIQRFKDHHKILDAILQGDQREIKTVTFVFPIELTKPLNTAGLPESYVLRGHNLLGDENFFDVVRIIPYADTLEEELLHSKTRPFPFEPKFSSSSAPTLLHAASVYYDHLMKSVISKSQAALKDIYG